LLNRNYKMIKPLSLCHIDYLHLHPWPLVFFVNVCTFGKQTPEKRNSFAVCGVPFFNFWVFGKNLNSDHSNESYSLRRTSHWCFLLSTVGGSSYFWVLRWNLKVWAFEKLLSCPICWSVRLSSFCFSIVLFFFYY